MRRVLSMLTACAIGFAAGLPRAAAQDEVAVSVVHDRSQGVVRVNGVPMHRFASRPPFNGPTKDTFGILIWATAGDNVISVEARATEGAASTQVAILRVGAPAALHEAAIDGAGATSYTASMAEVPHWAWLDADAAAGDEAGLLAAVRDLHDAFARRDFDRIDAVQRAAYDDLAQIYGPVPTAALVQMRGRVVAGQLAPLPSGLTVESHYDGRLFVVAGADGTAPVTIRGAEDPDRPFESGRYWIRRDGSWQVVRW